MFPGLELLSEDVLREGVPKVMFQGIIRPQELQNVAPLKRAPWGQGSLTPPLHATPLPGLLGILGVKEADRKWPVCGILMSFPEGKGIKWNPVP